MISVFTKNASITFFSKIIALFAGLLASVILARVLGPEKKGIYSLAILLPGILYNFFEFGIISATAFYVGKKKYSIGQAFSNTIFLSFFWSIIGTIAGIIVVILFRHTVFGAVPMQYLVISFLFLPINLFAYFTSAILLGIEKIWQYNMVFLLSSICELAGVFFLVFVFKLGILGAVLSYVLCFLPSVIFLFILIGRLSKGTSFTVNKHFLKDTFYFGVKSHLANIFTFLHFQINILLVSFYINPLAVGFFSLANDIIIQSQPLTQSAVTVLFPRVITEDDEEKKKRLTPMVCRNIIFITFLGTLLVFFLAKWITVFFYSGSFLNSVLPLKILLPVVVAFAGSQILAIDFVGRGKPMINTYVNGVALVLDVLLSILWIPMFGIQGAAMAMTVSCVCMFIAKVVIYSNISKNTIRDIVLISSKDIIFYKNFVIFYYRAAKNILGSKSVK